MNDNTIEILHPERTVNLAGGAVVVREMPWKGAIKFAAGLSDVMGAFVGADGQIEITPEKVAAVLMRSGDLAEDLVARSTGMEPAKIGELRPVDMLALLKAAVEVNIHPDLLGKAQEVGQALRDALGLKPAEAGAA